MFRRISLLVLFVGFFSATNSYAACSNEVLYFLDKIAKDTDVLEAIKSQNTTLGAIDQKTIIKLDKNWREMVKSALPIREIKKMLESPVSAKLAELQNNTSGLITEIIVMDAKGLNVAISQPTSDYWQGDEPKWSETYAVGPKGTHVSDVYLDDSTKLYQVQISRTLRDAESDEPIGAVTIGYNVKRLVGSLVGLDIGR